MTQPDLFRDGVIADTPVVRETSITAFYHAVGSGVIKTRAQQAWVGLQALQQATQNEVIQYVKRTNAAKSHSLTPRFAGLRDQGLIREVGERFCTVTGEHCLVWEVVPPEEYVAVPVVKERCPQCHQVIKRTYPRRSSSAMPVIVNTDHAEH